MKVKGSPLQAMKAHGDVDARVHLFTATALGWGRMASPTLGRLYPQGHTPVLIYRRLSGPQGQSGHEGVKKNLHPSDTRDRNRAIQSVAKRLAAWATWPTLCLVELLIRTHHLSRGNYSILFRYVHLYGAGGSMSACHAAGMAAMPGRDLFSGWGFFGVFLHL